MASIAYYKVTDTDLPIHEQRAIISRAGRIDKAFSDHAISVRTPTRKRPGFRSMLLSLKTGDVIRVTKIDRLGKDAIDISQSLHTLMERGVTVDILDIGRVSQAEGRGFLDLIDSIASIEKQSIYERTLNGRMRAKQKLAVGERTKKGKSSMGRPKVADYERVKQWRLDNDASISQTANHFGISTATVKRCMRV
ncbi:MAG: recombinase family protein [Betaproteobacteria bacterium]